MRIIFKFSYYDDDYTVVFTTHYHYEIYLNEVVVFQGKLSLFEHDDAYENTDFLRGYACCIFDAYLLHIGEEAEHIMFGRNTLKEVKDEER